VGAAGRRPTRLIRWTRRVALVGAALLAVGSLALQESVQVVSDSMAPTLRAGDRVLLDPWSTGAPSIGDVVVFRVPGSGELAVKRVIGTAGDTIGLEDGRLHRNGRLIEESYVDLETVDSVYFGPVRVPAGSMFLMGDNRGLSVDSRSYGPVEHSRILGRVLARWWPPRP
jgi:signal peptidase I